MALTLDFTGKHPLVFGGTTGIGFGVAQKFLEHGANVSVASRKQENVDAAMAARGQLAATLSASPQTFRDFHAVGRRVRSEFGCGWPRAAVRAARVPRGCCQP